MTGSVSRRFYRQLLLLYPGPFREEFGDEMLGMFDECSRALGAWRVLVDIALSAVRQQVHYLSTPVSMGAFLYSEIRASPNLARILAIAAFGVGLIASVFAGGKPEAPKFPAMVRSEALFWFPVEGWERYCPHAPQRTRVANSVLAVGVLVARKAEDPSSLRMVGIACGQYWSSVPELTGRPNTAVTWDVSRRDRSRSNDLTTTPN